MLEQLLLPFALNRAGLSASTLRQEDRMQRGQAIMLPRLQMRGEKGHTVVLLANSVLCLAASICSALVAALPVLRCTCTCAAHAGLCMYNA